ncbi:hypothetical protein AAF712_014279 [Marasmius tenuissimus]|uniref:Transmembrane protein n=1 Tax=Marasmius tenuissimus TaxID=585030 RepID=A0ABR2ZBG4_9AGAR
MIFLDSWLFVFSSGLLIFGIGLETTPTACRSAILICVAFYISSKVLIYLFLSEKVLVIWSITAAGGRFRSPVYLICLATMFGYVAVLILMILGATHFWREDGACVIGLKPFSSIPLLVYDLYLTIFLNGLFLWPICRSNIGNPRIRRVAVRTLVASVAALVTSAVNIGVLTFQHGRQLGWVCLGSCGTDVVLNALAIFWLTNPNSDTHSQSPTEEPQPLRPGRQLGRLSLSTFLRTRPQPQRGSIEYRTEITTPTVSRFLSSIPEQQGDDQHTIQVVVTTEKSEGASEGEECLDAKGPSLEDA